MLLISISTHTPHAGRNAIGGTVAKNIHNFNSHAPYGAQRMLIYFYIIPDRISTHTPHAGRNLNYIRYWQANGEFQLTRPMRGATLSPTPLSSRANISTHTPHAGRNAQARGCSAPQSISTHTPHAGRNKIFFCIL